MNFYTGITLVDITATGVIRYTNDNELERNQQRNWETVLQCIGIKAQPLIIEGPYTSTFTIDETTHFPDIYFGNHKVWFFSFLVTDERYPPATNSPTDVTRKWKTGEQVD